MKKINTLLFALLITISSYGQFGSLSLSLGLPQNEFRENTDATGFGGDLSFGFPFQKGAPIFFGFDFNYMVYGSNRQQETLTADIIANGAVISRLEIPLEIVNTNSMFGTHAFIRAQAPFDIVQPYVEGLVGFRYISTSTKILDLSEDGIYSDAEDNVIVRQTVLDDWVFSYGYGGGFMIKMGKGIYLDLRADFFKGQKAEYYDGDDTEAWTVEFNSSAELFDPENLEEGDLTFATQARESTTDLLLLKLGLAFKI